MTELVIQEDSIHPFKKAEEKTYLDLLLSCIGQDDLNLPKDAVTHYFNHAKHIVTNEQSKLPSLFIEHKQKPVGFALGTLPEAGVATVIWLLIHPEQHGCGLGKKLLHALIDCYQDTDTHKLKLTTNNPKARLFYEHLGWQVEGFHQRHWWGLNFWSLGYSLS